MQHNFKVGDKVKVKPYLEFDFSDELYEMTQNDVFNIANSVFTVAKVDSGGDLYLDTWDVIDYFFAIHPQDVIPVSTKNPRKHAELIKQWAGDDSLEIEASFDGKYWIGIQHPDWTAYHYRIKPKTVTKWKWAYKDCEGIPRISDHWYTEEEVKSKTWGSDFIKVDFTAKEVEV